MNKWISITKNKPAEFSTDVKYLAPTFMILNVNLKNITGKLKIQTRYFMTKQEAYVKHRN